MKIAWSPWRLTSYSNTHLVNSQDASQYILRFRQDAEEWLVYNRLTIIVWTNHPVKVANHIIASGASPMSFNRQHLFVDKEVSHEN